MSDNLVSDKPPLVSFLEIIGILLIGFLVIGPAIGLMVASLFFEINILQRVEEMFREPDARYFFLVMQGVAAFVGLLLLPMSYVMFRGKKKLSPFFRTEQWGLVVPVTMAAAVCLFISISPLVEWNANLEFPDWMGGFARWAEDTEKVAAEMVSLITDNMTPGAFIAVMIVVAVLPGIGEEFVFRGLIQTELQRAVKNPHAAIWVTAVLFSAIHLQFMGFVPRVLIGAFLGYLYFWSGNLWVPVIAHFFNNGAQVLFLYLAQKGLINFDVESTDQLPWPMVITAIVCIFPLMIYLRNYFRSRSTITSGIT